jgi:hypothetical protein
MLVAALAVRFETLADHLGMLPGERSALGGSVGAPAIGLGARLPLIRKAFTRLTTKETDTPKCAAAARHE